MNKEQDIRWEQRLSNYKKALNRLEEAVNYIEHHLENKENSEYGLNDLLKQAVIKGFEYTYELAWNVMRDYARYQGISEIRGSRDAIREAFGMELIYNGEVWMDMIKSRNNTSHSYDESTADNIFNKIMNEYYYEFLAFRDTMESIQENENNGMRS